MAGLTFDGIPSTRIDSSTFSGTLIQVNNVFSTGSFILLGDVTSSLGSITAPNVSDTQGRFRSTLLGSGATQQFAGWIQAGSASTSAGSAGFIALNLPYTSTGYYVQLTGKAFVNGVGSVAPFISGARSTSGVNFVGAASATYDWLAVGI